MQIWWATLVSVILVLIIWGIVSSKFRAKEPVSFGGLSLPKLSGTVSAEQRYSIVINSGARFEKVRIIGFAEAVAGPDSHVVWSATRWLVLEEENGKRSFVSPYTIRFFQEA